MRYRAKCFLKSSLDDGDLEESADIELSKNPDKSGAINSFDISNPSSAIIRVNGTGPYFDINSIWIRDRKMVDMLSEYLQNSAQTIHSSIGASTFYGHGGVSHISSDKVFKIFSLQDQAFQYFDKLNSKTGIKIFSFESALTGKRKFLVTDVKDFISRYVAISYGKRHVYEIIRESYPCRLYFDIEFCISSNPGLNGDDLCRQWIGIVSWKLFEVYGLLLDSESIIELDSSNADKFSRHLVFVLFANCRDSVFSGVLPSILANNKKTATKDTSDGMLKSGGDGPNIRRTVQPQILPELDQQELLFRSNLEIGQFVHAVVRDVLLEVRVTPHVDVDGGSSSPVGGNCGGGNEKLDTEDIEEDQVVLPRLYSGWMRIKRRYRHMWVWDKERRSQVCFVDLGVYTRNRAFRLLLSSKYGKSTSFSVAGAVSMKKQAAESLGCRRGTEKKTNYLVRLNKALKQNGVTSVPHASLLAEVLERTFVVPVGVIGPVKPRACSGYQSWCDQSVNYSDSKDMTRSRFNLLPAVFLRDNAGCSGDTTSYSPVVNPSDGLGMGDDMISEEERGLLTSATMSAELRGRDYDTSPANVLASEWTSTMRVEVEPECACPNSVCSCGRSCQVGSAYSSCFCTWCGYCYQVPHDTPCSRCRNGVECFAVAVGVESSIVVTVNEEFLGNDRNGSVSLRPKLYSRRTGITTAVSASGRSEVILSSSHSMSHVHGGYGIVPSPFPLLDEFIITVAMQKGGAWRDSSDVLTKSGERSGANRIYISHWEVTSFTFMRDDATSATAATAAAASTVPVITNQQGSAPSSQEQKHPTLYSITYQISGSRYCCRIGREHKSNHIMFEVNLLRGFAVQKCWDPDCRGYRSPPIYIYSQDVLPMYDIVLHIIDSSTRKK